MLYANAYPPIVAEPRQLRFNLSWSRCRKLITVHDDKVRLRLTLQAEKEEWPPEKLEDAVWHKVSEGGRSKN